MYNYHYDQLNRIVAMDLFNGLNVNAGTFTAGISTDYQERTSYDPNGNILTYLRNGDGNRLSMDNLSYFYKSGTNQLHKVTDGAVDAPANDYSKYNDLRQGQLDSNYRYDAIGNLISDAKDTITSITWNVYGKIQSITKNGQVIRYIYDAAGNRIFKYTPTDTTAYVRDASGNVLSVYTRPAGQSPIVQSETHLYGSSRLGIATRHFAVDTSIVLSGGFGLGQKSIFTRGEKLFELSNHLGNVLASIADRRIPVDANSDGTIESYKADLVSAQDYYTFGMQMPGRKYAALTYRYGFNGKEQDKETTSTTTYDYGFRIYSPALGRFLSVDPLTRTYPWYTPYQFAGNKPIWATDVDGLEENTSSTYVYHPPVIAVKPTFKGVISITDATTQTAHKTFSGNFAQLRKADATGMAPSIVNQLTGSNEGTGSSRLDITMSGTRSAISKSWKGTDIKYFTQYSYSFTSNNVTEKGSFELQTGTVQASARAWDPLTFLVLNKVVSSVVINAVRIGGPAATEEMVTLYRSISAAEAESIKSTGKLSLGTGMEVKQFWQTEEALKKWNQTGLAGEYNLEISVPKSLIGNGKPINTAVQVDEFIGPNATIDRSVIETVNKSIKTIKITPIKSP